MPQNRRQFLTRTLMIPGVAGLLQSFRTKQQPIDLNNRLVLLGTQGGPLVRNYGQTPSSNVIVSNGVPFVIDAGYGVTLKLKEAGVNLAAIRYIFITHHHSDHNLELGPLLYNAWISGLSEVINVYGPIGLTSLLEGYWASNKFDIDTRVRDEGRPDIRKLVVGHEIKGGVLIANDQFEISALKNIHPPIDQSFAYKFKVGAKTVVFSGDTAYCPALADFASGADYLVHEVMYIPAVDAMTKRRPNAATLKASILSHHTSTGDVGRIATTAGARNLILNHFVPPDDKSLTEQVWKDAVAVNFKGNIVVGKDLLQLPL